MWKYMLYFSLILFLFALSCGRYNFLTEDQWLDQFGKKSGGGGSKVLFTYVKIPGEGGNDANDGLTPATAKQTITGGITAALASGRKEVHVAVGAYTDETSITMESGVSLFGGFSSDFQTRDRVNFPTKIALTGTWGIIASGSAADTFINGFDITCSGNQTIHYQYGTGNLIISDNNISNSYAGASYGIVVQDCDNIMIANNQIICATSPTNSTGIQISNSNARIINNVIIATTGSYTYGIELRDTLETRNCSSIIRNNTIDNGTGTTRNACINFYDDSLAYNISAVIENNIFASSDTFDTNNMAFYCVDSPVWTLNNNLYYHLNYGSFGPELTDLTLYNGICTLLFLNYSSRNYHLLTYSEIYANFTSLGYTVSDAVFVVSGGATLDYNRDKDGKPRTAGWSVGAYEQDN